MPDTAPTSAAPDLLPLAVRGGDYAAVQDTDGTWTIKDVPIFTTHEREITVQGPKGAERRTVKVDRAWLDRAVSKAKARYERDRYLAPTTVRHNGGVVPAEPAGVFLPHSVREMEYEGERRPWVFADLGKIPPEKYEAVRKYLLLFRSPETTVNSDPEFLALSLLPTETPYFRGPLTTIGSERPNPAAKPRVSYSHRRGQPVLAYAADGDRASFLMRSPMPEPTAEPIVAPATAAATETPVRSEADAGSKILSALEAISQKLDQLLGGAKPGPSVPAEPEGDESSEYAAKVGELRGTVAALAARLDKADADKRADAMIARYAEELAAVGHQVKVADLAAEYAEGGEKGLAAYVKAVKTHGVAAPPASIDGALETSGAAASIPDDVACFASFGVDAVSRAAEFAAAYDASPAFAKTLDRRTYIARNLQGLNLMPRSAAVPARK